jgi:hypothetical protein
VDGLARVLRDHAAWSGRPGAERRPADSLTKSLGPLADDALRIVEAYALGARVEGATRSPAEFGTRLDLILNGIEASLAAPAARPADAPPHVIQSELWQLLRKIRESADCPTHATISD